LEGSYGGTGGALPAALRRGGGLGAGGGGTTRGALGGGGNGTSKIRHAGFGGARFEGRFFKESGPWGGTQGPQGSREGRKLDGAPPKKMSSSTAFFFHRMGGLRGGGVRGVGGGPGPHLAFFSRCSGCFQGGQGVFPKEGGGDRNGNEPNRTTGGIGFVDFWMEFACARGFDEGPKTPGQVSSFFCLYSPAKLFLEFRGAGGGGRGKNKKTKTVLGGSRHEGGAKGGVRMLREKGGGGGGKPSQGGPGGDSRGGHRRRGGEKHRGGTHPAKGVSRGGGQKRGGKGTDLGKKPQHIRGPRGIGNQKQFRGGTGWGGGRPSPKSCFRSRFFGTGRVWARREKNMGLGGAR